MAGKKRADHADSIDARYGPAAGKAVIAAAELVPDLLKLPEEKWCPLLERVERAFQSALETNAGGYRPPRQK